MKPIIAIVGRPNVGKSTVFNRLLGQRKAVTLDTSGVTRDRHYGPVEWQGKNFLCVDTGGFPEEKGSLQEKVKHQIDLAVHEADRILFILDGAAGLTPGDLAIARSLRKSGKKVFWVVNKIDQSMHEDRLADFYELGEELFPISAEHGYRIRELLDKLVSGLPEGDEEAKKNQIRLAIVGRPNVGKSSLVNRILGEERAVVDAAPGTTRDVIDTPFQWNGHSYLLLDTAGIRKKGKWSTAVERQSVLKTLQAIERCNLCLVLLDASEGVQKQDLHIAGYADELKKPILFIWNKWDLVPPKRGRQEQFLRHLNQEVSFLSHAPVLFTSTKTGEGIESIEREVHSLHKTCGTRVPTRTVNEVFEQLVQDHTPPQFRNRNVRLLYATQTAIYPPTFVIFSNRPEGISPSYERYLIKGFRQKLQFEGAPLKLFFRKKG